MTKAIRYGPLLIAMLLCWLSGPIQTTAQTYYTEQGHVVFTSSVPLHSFQGISDKLVGKVDFDQNVVDFYLDLNTLKTGNSKRDRDMYKTLESQKYPFAEFYGSFTPMPDSTFADSVNVTVAGTFKMHGESKEITVTGIIHRTSETLMIDAGWEIRLEDFNIEPPGILFYKVDQVQKIELTTELKRIDK